MSYDLVFWAGGDDLDPETVCTRLYDGENVESVEPVSRDAVLESFEERLPGWRWEANILQPPEADPEGAPAFEVDIAPQYVFFSAKGCETEHLNAVIEAMLPLGLRLYDPQVQERFA